MDIGTIDAAATILSGLPLGLAVLVVGLIIAWQITRRESARDKLEGEVRKLQVKLDQKREDNRADEERVQNEQLTRLIRLQEISTRLQSEQTKQSAQTTRAIQGIVFTVRTMEQSNRTRHTELLEVIDPVATNAAATRDDVTTLQQLMRNIGKGQGKIAEKIEQLIVSMGQHEDVDATVIDKLDTLGRTFLSFDERLEMLMTRIPIRGQDMGSGS